MRAGTEPDLSRRPFEINDLMENRMAGNLHVRNLDDDLIARLKRRAARHGRSTEAEHRHYLRQALVGDVELFLRHVSRRPTEKLTHTTPATDALKVSS